MKSEPIASFVISLDFELEWGIRDRSAANNYRGNLHGARRAIPRLLDLFSSMHIHATWATVGFLFFEGREALLTALPSLRPSYTNARFDPYRSLAELGEDESADPLHFAPSLIRTIAATPGQEIGTHTFSHYYCLEDGQGPEEFRSDIRAAQLAAHGLGISVRSLVFPRNQLNMSYLGVAAEEGIRAYRGNHRAWLYRSTSRANETMPRRALRMLDSYVRLSHVSDGYIMPASAQLPVNVPASRFLRPYSRRLRVLESQRLSRITQDIHRAAREGAVYHLWWHPHNFGADLAENLNFLGQILACVTRLRDRGLIASRSMGEVAESAIAV